MGVSRPAIVADELPVGGGLMLDVLCVGEALIDFLPLDGVGRPVRDVDRWVRCTGGAPANVAVGVARLGGRAGFLGVMGDDEHGAFLRESLAREGVDVSRVRAAEGRNSGLAFIAIDERGDRSFSFHRNGTAEFLLAPADLEPGYLSTARVIQHGTNSLLLAEARAAAVALVEGAKQRGQILSCDPNLRLKIWKEPRELRALLERLLPGSSVVKLAEDEVEFVTGERDVPAALEALERMGVALPIVTLGERGAMLRFRGQQAAVPARPVQVVDTTGAGDGFMAALLLGLAQQFRTDAELRAAELPYLIRLAGYACAVGSRVCETLGAVPGLPRAGELGPMPSR